MVDVKDVINDYKNHTGTYICNKYNISKYELSKILKSNNIATHSTAETTSLSAKEHPNQGTTGRLYYNNGIEQGRFKPGTQPNGWEEGALKFTKDQTELMLARRGNRSPMLTDQGKTNYVKAIQDKYGNEYTNGAQLPQSKEKTKSTNLDRYGVEYAMQDPEIRERAETTCQERYGSTYYIGSKECRDKYGASNLIKALETKKKNHTFNTSQPEEDYYNYLVDLYGADDVARQYSDKRYPFACDFYIKSKDLFIECNYSWTHGGHPFDKNNEDDLKKLIKWEDKANEGSKYVRNAIHTWTIRDVNKRNTAKQNNLNYIEIFN